MATAPIIGISRHRILSDGEGVTTLIAFHGCPLRCKYCLNAQCLSANVPALCSCDTLYQKIAVDELYFLATGGGVTFGGGEPALQSDFIAEFRTLCGNKWSVNIETSLNISRKHLTTLLPIIDNYIIDIKDTNPQIYKAYTSKDNKQVVSNLKWLIKNGKANKITIRVPNIPNFNCQQDVDLSVNILKELGVVNFDIFTYTTNLITNETR